MKFLANGAPPVKGVAYFLAKLERLCVLIEDLALRLRFEKRLLFVLAMDVAQGGR